ncbi:hypothetical protein [Nostoc punctiforme]|uniref:Uncharacterized protein n=2 Tax=Nostoc punctiforme TaxID=272131 RepID=B2ITB7_NOSP7|nr:hypothetical protein [Nostoc punctiforme]ACC81148.1 hypothetical protein Npun_R2594 [Nostoc punctiforme PCC 73102]RCJ29199.1 hypothetical protein A6769_35990 [Nostoc punctiforme NIES-2108]
MTKTETFNRLTNAPKTAKSLPLTAAIADGTDESFIVDIYTPVTLDGGGTANKVLFRVVLPYSILESDTEATITLSSLIYAFAGNATTYAAGGVTPSLNVAKKENVVHLDAFLTAAGDTRDDPPAE